MRLLATAAAILSLSTSYGATLFDTGTASGSGNNPFSVQNLYIAEDFVLLAPSEVTSITFDAYTTSGFVPITGINAKIYANNNGGVGTELYSGIFNVASVANLSSVLVSYTFLVPGWNLQAGVYWLALQVDPAQSALHWASPVNNTLPMDVYQGGFSSSTGTTGSYTPYFSEHNFRIQGDAAAPTSVPDSGSTVTLLGLAMTSIGFFRRKFAV